jgi:hypothetical protein
MAPWGTLLRLPSSSSLSSDRSVVGLGGVCYKVVVWWHPYGGGMMVWWYGGSGTGMDTPTTQLM